ncbi:uncharacterized protein LOC111887907 [Lactuca sativa]|uniref:Uncharacterized protein n=1 Tax=Lactuca sativa TaxID=4236 RepID=A0A9R1W2A6_LACSA|nr:uncharacterized protein LOC111887907 [Lactuca sativa]KAJ0216163.1 hypothetical protein LSAT_V11C300150210 [Lactuca sativa]
MASNDNSPMSSPEYTSDDAMTDDLSEFFYYYEPRKSFTENNAATYASSGNPCLDFFFHVVPDTRPKSLISRLQVAWNHDPLTTLKLVCNLRGVRGTGKSDKEGFYTAALWLHNHHPKTLASNIPLLVEFGYFKDLLEILYRLIQGSDVRKIAKEEWTLKKLVKGKGGVRKQYFLSKKKMNRKQKKNKAEMEMKAKLRAKVPREQRIEANRAHMKAEQERAKASRKEKISAMAEKLQDRYNSDEDYKNLHDQVSSFFANRLKSDIQSLNSGDSTKISLAAKWCPSVDSSYDNATLICESIARMIYPRNSNPEFDGLDDTDYVFKVKNRLRKQVLVPLRNALQLPEVYMSAKQWSSITYERVASIAMKNYTDIFLHRDNARFHEYLQNVTTGDAKIAAGALLPHEIIASLDRGSGAAIVAELQWKRMVDDLLKKGKLTNCIAVCDVSGSMSGTPMEVAVALGLLVSELSADPWKGHVITFSESPELHQIKGNNLRSKTEFIRKMKAGFNTNFQKVFDRLLEVAVKEKLGEDEMVERVFVFSDMEFDQASETSRYSARYHRWETDSDSDSEEEVDEAPVDPWETDYEAIERKFKSCGYAKVPEIVFWNLRNSKSTPVTVDRKGVALLSGFSKNLLTLFLEEGGVIKPEDVADKNVKGSLTPLERMEAAISGELYQKLVVYD